MAKEKNKNKEIVKGTKFQKVLLALQLLLLIFMISFTIVSRVKNLNSNIVESVLNNTLTIQIIIMLVNVLHEAKDNKDNKDNK